MIFIARVADVTLGTVRVIFVSRGMKYLAPLIGFVEILIWLMAIGHTMQNLTNPACYVAYAGGFAMGNFVGITIAERLSLGVVMIRVITAHAAGPTPQSRKLRRHEHRWARLERTGQGRLHGRAPAGSILRRRSDKNLQPQGLLFHRRSQSRGKGRLPPSKIVAGFALLKRIWGVSQGKIAPPSVCRQRKTGKSR